MALEHLILICKYFDILERYAFQNGGCLFLIIRCLFRLTHIYLQFLWACKTNLKKINIPLSAIVPSSFPKCLYVGMYMGISTYLDRLLIRIASIY